MAQFFNQATLNYNGGSINSNITTGEITQVLAVTKQAVQDSYAPGDIITYVVSVVNSGSAPFTGLTLTDDLGAYTFDEETLTPLSYMSGSLLYYVNGAVQTAPTVVTTPTLTIGPFTVPAGGNVIFVYQARANEFAAPGAGGVIDNEVSITGGGLSAPITGNAQLSASPQARLSINKALSPATVTENGRITYTFTIQNGGSAPVTAADLASIVDVFDPILSDLTVTFNGSTWVSPTQYTYDETTGSFATVAGQITVPAATYTQDETTGAWVVTPGVSTLVVSGTV